MLCSAPTTCWTVAWYGFICKCLFWLFEDIFDGEVLGYNFWGIFGLLAASVDRKKVPKILHFDTGVVLACLEIIDLRCVVMRLVSMVAIVRDGLREQL